MAEEVYPEFKSEGLITATAAVAGGIGAAATHMAIIWDRKEAHFAANHAIDNLRQQEGVLNPLVKQAKAEGNARAQQFLSSVIAHDQAKVATEIAHYPHYDAGEEAGITVGYFAGGALLLAGLAKAAQYAAYRLTRKPYVEKQHVDKPSMKETIL